MIFTQANMSLTSALCFFTIHPVPNILKSATFRKKKPQKQNSVIHFRDRYKNTLTKINNMFFFKSKSFFYVSKYFK